MLDAALTPALDAVTPSDHQGCYSIRPWACVYTHPQAERWADTNLQRAGYRTFLPLLTVRQRDRVVPTLWHTVERPAFSRYLFIRFDHRTASWSPIRATPGVLDLVRNGSELAYASEAAVSAVQAAIDVAATRLPLSRQWAPGMPCSLTTGPFSGHPAVITQVGADMATVAILMFGALREVAVQLDALQPRTE